MRKRLKKPTKCESGDSHATTNKKGTQVIAVSVCLCHLLGPRRPRHERQERPTPQSVQATSHTHSNREAAFCSVRYMSPRLFFVRDGGTSKGLITSIFGTSMCEPLHCIHCLLLPLPWSSSSAELKVAWRREPPAFLSGATLTRAVVSSTSHFYSSSERDLPNLCRRWCRLSSSTTFCALPGAPLFSSPTALFETTSNMSIVWVVLCNCT